MKKVAIIGECMIELNGKPFGEMTQTFGGDTLNAAVYLSRGCELNGTSHNIDIQYVTALGNDPISHGMIERWQQEGINTNLVLRDSNRTPGLYLIQLDEHGERTFLYWRNQSPARYLMQHPQMTDIAQQLKDVDMVFLSGISLAILPEEDRADLIWLLAELRQSGVEIAFDSNFRPALWPQDDDNASVKESYLALYQICDLALVTYDDEALLWGDPTPHDTLTRLEAQGVKKAVVKLGSEGCLVQDFSLSKPEKVATTPVSHVVDTTSAGDSFNGGFLSSYLNNGTLVDSSQRGNAMAGIVIQHKGAIIPKDKTDQLNLS
ncbi:sugar kinase [Vibrio sp.]|nr:sugar kinase [Vibrio sp.]